MLPIRLTHLEVSGDVLYSLHPSSHSCGQLTLYTRFLHLLSAVRLYIFHSSDIRLLQFWLLFAHLSAVVVGVVDSVVV